MQNAEWLDVRVRTNGLGDYSSGYGHIGYVGPQAICPDTFLVGVTPKIYNTSIDYENITYACVHGGRAYVQERLVLEEVEGDAILSKALLRFLNCLFYDYAYSVVIPHCIANVSSCILSQYGANMHYQHKSSDIGCNQQHERSRKGRPMNFMSLCPRRYVLN